PPRSPLFPYTTLFRSPSARRARPRLPRGRCGAGLGALAQSARSADSQTVKFRPAIVAAIALAGILTPLASADAPMTKRQAKALRSEEHTSELQSRGHL